MTTITKTDQIDGSTSEPTTARRRGLRRLGVALAGIALAAGASVAGAAPANAVGSCSSTSTFGGGNSPSSFVAECQGTVSFTWRCSSDLFFRYNVRVVDYGPTWNTRSFVGCDEGYITDPRYASA